MRKLVFIFMVFSLCGYGQKFNTLSKGEKEKFQKAINDEIKTFDSKLQRIANASSKEFQTALIESLLRKFTPEATIQTASVKSGKNTYKIRDYLYKKVPGYTRKYSVIDVDFVSININKLQPHPTKPNQYIAHYSFVQRFCAIGKGTNSKTKEGLANYDYCDLTEKEGSVVLKKVHTVLGSKWRLFMDSIKVLSVAIIDTKKE